MLSLKPVQVFYKQHDATKVCPSDLWKRKNASLFIEELCCYCLLGGKVEINRKICGEYSDGMEIIILTDIFPNP